jgi:hypothetical protein
MKYKKTSKYSLFLSSFYNFYIFLDKLNHFNLVFSLRDSPIIKMIIISFLISKHFLLHSNQSMVIIMNSKLVLMQEYYYFEYFKEVEKMIDFENLKYINNFHLSHLNFNLISFFIQVQQKKIFTTFHQG